MLDLDHFKPYNDHYGRKAGDPALQQPCLTTSIGSGPAATAKSRFVQADAQPYRARKDGRNRACGLESDATEGIAMPAAASTVVGWGGVGWRRGSAACAAPNLVPKPLRRSCPGCRSCAR